MEEHEDELGEEPENYRSFVYFYDKIPSQEDIVNQTPNQQQISISAESQTMNVELHSGTKSHLGAEL